MQESSSSGKTPEEAWNELKKKVSEAKVNAQKKRN
jgi:hypothetical protein